MKTIAWTAVARRQLRKLPAQAQTRIRAKLADLAAGRSADVTALVGESGSRIRIGDYRAVFVETEDTIEVRKVGHRRDIYN